MATAGFGAAPGIADPDLGDDGPANKPLVDFVRHLLQTESGRAILIPAAQHWKFGERWTRAELVPKTPHDDAHIQMFIRILGRPINSKTTNPTQIPLWDTTVDDGKYCLTTEVHAEVLRQIEPGEAAA